MGDSISQRVVKLETQVSRLLSDAESEKETRANTTKELDVRLRSVERTVAIGIGALGLLQLVLASLRYLK